MESANVFGSDEDCPSCESGWTMYLASHSQDHEDGCHYEDDDDEEDSDGGDSMDSDASSGPMEAISVGLKSPQKIEEQNSVKKKNKKKTNEEMVMVETTRVKDDDDDDDNGDDHDYDDGNDSYSVVHSYVGSAFRQVKG